MYSMSVFYTLRNFHTLMRCVPVSDDLIGHAFHPGWVYGHTNTIWPLYMYLRGACKVWRVVDYQVFGVVQVMFLSAFTAWTQRGYAVRGGLGYNSGRRGGTRL